MEPVRIKINENVFEIIRDDYFKVLLLEDYINNSVNINKIIANENIKAIVIRGNIESSVFDDLSNIISTSVHDNSKFIVEKFYQLKKSKQITIDDSFDMPIDFSKFKELVDLEIQWNPNLKFEDAKSLKWLHLRKYGQEIFELLLPDNIEYLLLTQGILKDISGIETLTSIKALDLCYLPKMENYAALSKLTNLEYLRFTNCGKIKNIDFIKPLKNLKWLCISGCREIDTLKPLYSLENLEGIHLTGTKILDNDKTIVKERANYQAYNYTSVTQRLYIDI